MSADNLTPEQFVQAADRLVYAPYQDAVNNLLTANINGELGTLTSKLNAYDWLSKTANKAKMFTDIWYQNIAYIIGDYHVIHHAITQDGIIAADVEIMLSTLPNGKINFDAILQQVQAVNAKFKLTLADYTDMIAKVFQMMAETGVLDVNSKDELKKMVRHQMTGAKYGETDYRNYYKQYIATNANSEWVQAGINEQQYVDFMMGRSGERTPHLLTHLILALKMLMPLIMIKEQPVLQLLTLT